MKNFFLFLMMSIACPNSFAETCQDILEIIKNDATFEIDGFSYTLVEFPKGVYPLQMKNLLNHPKCQVRKMKFEYTVIFIITRPSTKKTREISKFVRGCNEADLAGRGCYPLMEVDLSFVRKTSLSQF